MAVVIGTNSGFCSSAPTGDPAGSNTTMIDRTRGQLDTSPSDATQITEIGWYADGNTNSGLNWECGVYDDNAGTPNNLLSGSDTTNSLASGNGWNICTGLSISISGSTPYWITVQLDDDLSATNTDRSSASGKDYFFKSGDGSLIDPMTGHTVINDFALAIYAVYSTGGGEGGTNVQLNISDAWKSIDAFKINIGDSWKDVTGAQINIGDAWKTIF